jgi:tetratricopeptide (TPR) repeat protein
MMKAMNKMVFWLTIGVIITFVLINMGVQKEILVVIGLAMLAIGSLARRMLGTYLEAVKKMKRRNYDTAISLFKEFISEVNYNPDLLKWQKFATFSRGYSYKETAYLNLGVCYYHKEKYDEAISYFKKAIEMREEMVEGYLNIAMIHFTQGNKEECYAWLEKAKLYRNAQFDKLVLEESFFDSVRKEKRFQKIVSLD